jgi:hypothetical protein
LRLGFERSDLIRIDTNHEVVDVIVGFVADGAPITVARPNKLDEGKDGPIDLRRARDCTIESPCGPLRAEEFQPQLRTS